MKPLYSGGESSYSSLISLLSFIYFSPQQQKNDLTRKFTISLYEVPIAVCGVSQEIKLSIHCEVLWFFAAEGRRQGEGHNSHGAVQGKPDEAHFSES